MAFPDLFKLEKLKIFAYSDVRRQKAIDGSPFAAMFNPQSLSQTFGSQFEPRKGVGGGVQSATFVRSQPSSLQLTLLLDGTGVTEMGLVNLTSSPKTVQDRINDFVSIAYTPQSVSHEPSFLRVQYGKFSFSCRLSSVTVNCTSFNRDGSPLRAELELMLIADAEVAKQQAQLAFNSPDVSHTRLVRGADTLPLMTSRVYGSTAPVPRVARANGLDHIRGLMPGRTLIFPPLAR